MIYGEVYIFDLSVEEDSQLKKNISAFRKGNYKYMKEEKVTFFLFICLGFFVFLFNSSHRTGIPEK